jgi:hypothetical protein
MDIANNTWRVRPQTVIVSTGVRIDLFTAEGGRQCMDVRTEKGTQRIVFADDGTILRIRTLTYLTPVSSSA